MNGELTIENDAVPEWPRGGERAEEIVESTRQPLYRFLYGMLGNSHEAEDLLQETYLAAQADSRRFRGDSSVLTWLTGIALNLARHRLRRRAFERRWVALGGLFGRTAESPARAAERKEESERVRAAVASLPERERAVLTMFDWEGLPHREIAAVLHCAEGTVWSLLSRARAEIARRLDDDR